MSAATCSTLLTVGEIDGDTALLASDDLQVVRLPLALLPRGIAVGHVIELSTARSTTSEQQRAREIHDLQAELQARLGPAPGSTSTAHDVLTS